MRKIFIIKLLIILTVFIVWLIFTLSKAYFYPDKDIKIEDTKYSYTRIYNVNKKRNDLSGISLELDLQIKDLDTVKNAGFKYVRVPTLLNGNHVVDKDVLNKLDLVIENCLNRELKIIITHEYSSWEILSKRYRNHNEDLWFELTNEYETIDSETWNIYVKESLDTIRGSGGINKNRNVIVGVNILVGRVLNSWDYISGIKHLELPDVKDDPNIKVLFNYFNPIPFTFQGETYSSFYSISNYWLGNSWTNTEKQKRYIKEDFDVITKWGIENSREVILGAFGVSLFADSQSNVNWTKLVKKEAEKRGMIWLFWQLNSVYNQEEGYWKKEIIDVLQLQDNLDYGLNEVQIDEFTKGLKDPDWNIRKEAALLLKNYAPIGEEAIPYLIQSLQDEEWQVRNAAIQALGHYGEAAYGAIPYLIKFLEDDEWQLRNSATIALLHFGENSKQALLQLIKNLRHEEWILRNSTAKTLTVIGKDARDSVPYLLENFDNEVGLFRLSLLEAMAAIDPNNKEVKECAKRALNDSNYDVRSTAKRILKRN